MDSRRFFLFITMVLILGGLFAFAGSAMATGTICGQSDNTIFPGLTVKKDVFCEASRTWTWDIRKSADITSLTLSPGQFFPVNYTVTASAQASGLYTVNGKILLFNTSQSPTNPQGFPITINEVTDSLAPVSCPLDFPFTIQPGKQVVCTYLGTLTDTPAMNEAFAIDANGVEYTGFANIDWSKATLTETDECATITDSLGGALGTVCTDQGTFFTFNYTYQVGPYASCGDYQVVNTASFTTNDTGATGASSWQVDINVPCAGGCSLTPGYWKTHSEFGPAPYDDTWAQLANGASTPFFLSGQTYYEALWTSPNGNAYYILAHAYIAAQLNFLNGADPSAAQAAFDQATALLQMYTPAQIGALRGSSALRQQFVSLAGILDNYNNGLIGPGHCSE